MDVGPFRGSGSADRRPASTAAQGHRQVEEPPVRPEPRAAATNRVASPRQAHREEKSMFQKLLWPFIAVLVATLLGVGGWFTWSSMHSAAALPIDSSKYQAVFFTNGQVYFGKLEKATGDYLKLKDIYYLQSQQAAAEGEEPNPQATTSDQNNVQLIKLGDEIHGPEDEMIISKDQVLFYENIKPTGTVAQSIEKSKSAK